MKKQFGPTVKGLLFGLVISCLSLFFLQTLEAQNIPQKIRFIGILTDRSNDFEIGSFTVVFNMYETSTGGTPVFTEAHPIIFEKKDRGIFTVDIGSITPLNFNFNTEYWMGITIKDAGGFTPGEMIPRIPVATSPYIFNIDYLDGVNSLSFLRSDTVINLLGTSSDSFTIDTDQSSNIPRLIFEDSDGDEIRT